MGLHNRRVASASFRVNVRTGGPAVAGSGGVGWGGAGCGAAGSGGDGAGRAGAGRAGEGDGFGAQLTPAAAKTNNTTRHRIDIRDAFNLRMNSRLFIDRIVNKMASVKVLVRGAQASS